MSMGPGATKTSNPLQSSYYTAKMRCKIDPGRFNPVPENGPGFLGLTSSLKDIKKTSEDQNGPKWRGSDIKPVSTSSAGT